jgi:hypothetical protein
MYVIHIYILYIYIYYILYIYIYIYIYGGVCVYITYIYMYTYVSGPLGGLSDEPKFKQDVKTRSKHSGEDVIKNVLIREVRFLGRKTTKQTQRRGRNIWHGWFN